MLIATFGPATAWAGRTITREGDVFTLEDHGPISAADVMEYDRQGHLVWTNDGTRAWVGSRIQTAATTAAANANALTVDPSTRQPDKTPVGQRHVSGLVIVVSLVAAVVLFGGIFYYMFD